MGHPVYLYTHCSASKGDEAKKAGQGDTGDTASMSSVTTTQSSEETDPHGRLALHKAVLEIVYSLSSDVSLKKNSMGLNQ